MGGEAILLLSAIVTDDGINGQCSEKGSAKFIYSTPSRNPFRRPQCCYDEMEDTYLRYNHTHSLSGITIHEDYVPSKPVSNSHDASIRDWKFWCIIASLGVATLLTAIEFVRSPMVQITVHSYDVLCHSHR